MPSQGKTIRRVARPSPSLYPAPHVDERRSFTTRRPGHRHSHRSSRRRRSSDPDGDGQTAFRGRVRRRADVRGRICLPEYVRRVPTRLHRARRLDARTERPRPAGRTRESRATVADHLSIRARTDSRFGSRDSAWCAGLPDETGGPGRPHRGGHAGARPKQGGSCGTCQARRTACSIRSTDATRTRGIETPDQWPVEQTGGGGSWIAERTIRSIGPGCSESFKRTRWPNSCDWHSISASSPRRSHTQGAIDSRPTAPYTASCRSVTPATTTATPPLVVVIEDDAPRPHCNRTSVASAKLRTGAVRLCQRPSSTGRPRAVRRVSSSIFQLPGISGLDLQHQLRAAGSNVPIIVTTGIRDTTVRERACREGCSAFFVKPSDGCRCLR